MLNIYSMGAQHTMYDVWVSEEEEDGKTSWYVPKNTHTINLIGLCTLEEFRLAYMNLSNGLDCLHRDNIEHH